MKRRVVCCAVVLLTAAVASGAVFQYRLDGPPGKRARPVFLWIPAEADPVRGVVCAGMTLMEQPFVKDPVIRAACDDQGLAILFATGGLGGTDLQATLDDFAALSGYRELSVAPLFFVGHSAGGGPAQKLAVAFADRCFGLCQYRGGTPTADNPIPPGIPALVMLGQFDEFHGTQRTEDGVESWERARMGFETFRAANAANTASLVVEPGAGHFAWSARNAEYLALFIAKAAGARIPDRWAMDSRRPPELLTIDHTTGWLTDSTLRGETACAPFADYPGDRAGTSWHFDRETAEATLAYHGGLQGKKDQFIKWNDPHWVDAGARHFFTKLEWVGDGRTLAVHPVYAETVPEQHKGQGPKWPNAGAPAEHSDAPIRVKPVAGPLVGAGSKRLRLEHDALSPAGAGSRATFMAFSEGDSAFRYTEHVGMMPRGWRGLTRGRAQTIVFPELADLARGGSQALNAVSDAGVEVLYYVEQGPAVIEGGRVRVAEVPKRAMLPVDVVVVAYQPGSGCEPRLRQAAPVKRAFRVVK